MEALTQLITKIDHKQAKIAVIGLGYVGLPVAAMFAQKGFQVTGIDIKQERVDLINRGISPIEGEEPGLAELLAEVSSSGSLTASTDYQLLKDMDVVLIDVETPVDEQHIPRYAALKSACQSLGAVLKTGALVIVESTIAPGTIDRVVKPLLEEHTRRKLNEGFYLGACPERVMPGKLLANLRGLSRVCGGSTPEVANAMVHLYRHIVEADLDTADPITAEMVKTTENAYRDVQIAFANEVALICEAVGADVWRVRELVNKSPFRNMHLPGAGVGGHCIPKDPWLLAYGAQDKVPLRLIPAARAVNDFMPYHMVDLTRDALAEVGVKLEEATIAVLGYAYLENSDDTRNSPSEVLVNELQRLGAVVKIHDPWVPEYQGDIMETMKGCDAVVIMVAHREYFEINWRTCKEIMKHPVVVDGRKVIAPKMAKTLELVIKGIGNLQ